MSSVDVFEESDGRWRWEYRDDKVSLKSNRTYGARQSALTAARIAYPANFGSGPSGSSSIAGGFIHKIAKLLTLVLVIVVWKRRRSHS